MSRLFSTRIGQWFLSLLAFLGIQWAAQKFAVDPVLDLIKSAVSGAPAVIIEWIGFLNLDRYVTLVLSAYAIAAAGSALKMRMKPKT
ncbi:MAG: DUF2523 family protein [Stenotrophomonas sp.]